MTRRHRSNVARTLGRNRWIAILGAVAFFAGVEARAADWYVDVNYPGCPAGSGGPNDPFCLIADALAVATDGDVIHVAPGTYAEHLVVPIDVTILGTQGPATTIVDGTYSRPGFVVPALTCLRIDGLTITHGVPGVKVMEDGELLMHRVVVSANTTGIATDGTVELQEALFVANTEHAIVIRCLSEGLLVSDSAFLANAPSGAISQWPFARRSTFRRCLFRHNHSTGGGGALQISCDTLVEITDCDISHNTTDRRGGGVAVSYDGTLRLIDTVISNNRAGIDGGGVRVKEGCCFLTRCSIHSNVAASNGGGISGDWYDPGSPCIRAESSIIAGNTALQGGGIHAVAMDRNGTLEFIRCEIRDNRADSGAGIYLSSLVDDAWPIQLTGTAVVCNQSTVQAGALYLDPLSEAILIDSTIAGNVAPVGGGAVVEPGGDPFAGHTIFGVNSAVTGPDVNGKLNSLGFNLVSDTADCTIVGDGTGNLLDVDPLFEAGGGYSLSYASPCIDAGDPARRDPGQDLRGHPRVLDGDLDRIQLLDMGALEFDHVQFSIRGNLTPGGSITIDSQGTPGLFVLLFIGAKEGLTPFPPFGILFLDLSHSWLFYPLGVLPDSSTFTIPINVPSPSDYHVQELAIDLAGSAGNLSSPLVVHIE